MSKIFRFEQYLEERDYFSPVSEDLYSEISDWVTNESINEGLLDTIKNKLSKNLLGDFSKVSAIDAIRKGNLEIEKDLVLKKYDFNDKLDALELKLAKVTRSGNRSAILAVQNEIDKKRAEQKAYIKSKKAQIENGLLLLSKAIDKNKRRKEYYEAGKAEDELAFANFEYDIAKKKSSSQKEVDKLKKSLDKAKADAEELIKRFKDSVSVSNDNPVEIESKDLINPDKIKKKLSAKKFSDLIEIKEKTKQNVNKKKEDLVKYLEDLANTIEKHSKAMVNVKSSVLASAEKKSTDLANEIDAQINLLNLYNNIGNSQTEIEKVLKDPSDLKSLFSKISNAIKDSKDDSSGISKEILVVFSDPTAKKLKQAIKKIK